MKKLTFKTWRKHLAVGLHALFAASMSSLIAQLAFYVAAAIYIAIFGDSEELIWLQIKLSIIFFVLVAAPLFGLVFANLYPRISETPKEPNISNNEADTV